jgi:hypothetical protein
MSNKISRWTILSEPYRRDDRHYEALYVDAKCDCGTERSVISKNITRKVSLSCGCLQKEVAAIQGGFNKKPAGVQARNAKYASYRKNAKYRDYSFDLTKDEFTDIILKPCLYCGSHLGNREKSKNDNGDFEYTGIDRVDNSIGYTLDNSVPCCKFCNLAKRDNSQEYFIEMCKKVAKENK